MAGLNILPIEIEDCNGTEKFIGRVNKNDTETKRRSDVNL